MWQLPVFVCDRHAEPGDLPLPSTVIFRRVRINALIDVAAVSWRPARAQNEAVCAMEAAVMAGGGLLDVLSVSSATGRHTAGSPPAAPNGDRSGGEG